jgi:ubiquinone/menaquinone biosynthesis C-methylase UbiE
MPMTQPSAPNHHTHFPGFAGPAGFVAAASMVPGGARNARLAEQLSKLAAGDAVADIGCGPGTAARRAARHAAAVVGVDPAPVMLRFARFLTRRSTHPVRYAEGSAEALPLPDSSVTVAWSIASVHHWKDLDAGLHEARRVLKPGGRLVAIERLSRLGAKGLASHGWTPEQATSFADRCLAHGFTDAKVNQHGSGRRTRVSVTATAPGQ